MQGRYRNGIPEEEKKRIAGCLFSGAIVIAPFVALLLDARLAMVVLAAALGAVAGFSAEAAKRADEQSRGRLIVLAAANGVLLVGVLVALLWLIVR
ncbi:MAG: hypothetical protein R2839_01535 [Thermomicrobiales bacterium]